MLTFGETFLSPAAGLRLYRHRFSPESPGGQPPGVVLMLHGLGDHLECHARAADEVFCPRGWLCEGVDWPGNGRSDGKRGHLDSIACGMEIIAETVEKLHRDYGRGMPLGAYAHSTGGFILLQYLHRLGGESPFQWIWLSSPLLNPTWRQSPLKVAAAPLLARILPRLTLDTGVRPPECFRQTGTPTQIRKRFEHCHHRISAAFGAELLRYSPDIDACASAIHDPTAMLITQGTADAICPSQFAENWFPRVAASRKHLALLPGLHHETLREPEDAAVLAANQWFDQLATPR